MEYRKRSTRRKKAPQMKAGHVLAGLLFAAAVIYLVSASRAGTWLAEKVIAPVFSAFDAEHNASSTAPSSQQAESSEKQQIMLPGINCYAVQLGVFTSKENAETLASDMSDKGAGCYILKDGDRYRVLASGYASKEEAKSVCSSLKESNIDCALYSFDATERTLQIPMSQKQAELLQTACEALKTAQSELTAYNISYDANESTAAAGKEAVGKISAAFSSAIAPLAAIETENAQFSSFLASFQEQESLLKDLAQSKEESFVAYSGLLKKAQLQLTDAYVKLSQ